MQVTTTLRFLLNLSEWTRSNIFKIKDFLMLPFSYFYTWFLCIDMVYRVPGILLCIADRSQIHSASTLWLLSTGTRALCQHCPSGSSTAPGWKIQLVLPTWYRQNNCNLTINPYLMLIAIMSSWQGSYTEHKKSAVVTQNRHGEGTDTSSPVW